MPDTAPGSTVAGIITAVATLVIAVGGAITAFGVLLPILRGTRKNSVAIGEVHTIVNQERTDRMRYQVALIKALEKAGVAVPDDQSLSDPQPPPPTSG